MSTLAGRSRRAVAVVVVLAALATGSVGTARADRPVDTLPKKVVSRAGDADNFGYGHGPYGPPCQAFDHREPGDEGVFDYEPADGADDHDAWVHRFDLRGRTPVELRFTVWETFGELGSPATLQLDHLVLELYQGMYSRCEDQMAGGVRHRYLVTGALAQQIAGDGVVTVFVNENGDDIALDRAKIVVLTA